MNYDITPMEIDDYGQAVWLDREAKACDPLQYARELLVNARDAGATKLIFDGWNDPSNNRTLMRVSDNGLGMTQHELRHHGKTLHSSGPGRETNFGVGGRLATLPHNPAGVIWASAAMSDDYLEESMIQLVRTTDRHGHRYGLLIESTNDGKRDCFEPTEGLLERVDQTGTAVVLRGQGRENTYNSDVINDIANFLRFRFMTFGLDVHMRYPDKDGDGNRSIRLMSYGEMLESTALEFGAVELDDEGTLARWWVLPPFDERKTHNGKRLVSCFSLLQGDEMFDVVRADDRGLRHYGNFGLTTQTLKHRVAIAIKPGFELTQSTNRGEFHRPHGEKLPWDLWIDRWHTNMPQPIRDLIDTQTSPPKDLHDEFEKIFGADYMRRMNLQCDPVPAKTGVEPAGVIEAMAPGAAGDGTSGGGGTAMVGDARPPRRRKISTDGDDGQKKDSKKYALPRVQWIRDPEEWSYSTSLFADYVRSRNVILMLDSAVHVQRAIAYWREQAPQYHEYQIRQFVEFGYEVEAISKVVGALNMTDWEPGWIDAALNVTGLSASLLGLNAVDAQIRRRMSSFRAQQ